MDKLGFPYSWFAKRRRGDVAFEFLDYVKRRHAASTGSGLVVAYPPGPPKVEDVVTWLYQLLGVLDQKASALMRLNGVMLAAAAFLMNPNYGSPELVTILVAFSAIASTISIACCLLVVSMDWPFLGLVRDENGQFNFSDEFFHLQQVVDLRQKFYRFGWTISLAAAGVFLVAIIIFFSNFLLSRYFYGC